jgi:hypothetical protein
MRTDSVNLSTDAINKIRSVITDKYGDKFAGINRFVYDDGSDPTLKSLPHCPSVVKKPGAKKGTLSHKVTCLDCGRCFHNHGKRIAVYNH